MVKPSRRDLRTIKRNRIADRAFLRPTESKHDLHKVLMWLPPKVSSRQLALHEVSDGPGGMTVSNAGARWVLPHQPMGMGILELDSKSPAKQSNIYLTSLKRQGWRILHRLTGKLDKFFSPMMPKQSNRIRTQINQGFVKDEVSIDFCKVLFRESDVVGLSAFHTSHCTSPPGNGQLLRGENALLNTTSADLPRLPFFLRSLSPFQDSSSSGRYSRYYRLRYVPLRSVMDDDLRLKPIEIDIVSRGKPGSDITNHVENVWTMIEEQSNKILLPAFAFDLNFVRRLRRRIEDVGTRRYPWKAQFQDHIANAGYDLFPTSIDVRPQARTSKHCHPSPQGNVEAESQSTPTSPTLQEVRQDSTGTSCTARPSVDIKATTMESSQSGTHMLESCHLVHFTRYQATTLCLEHLDFDRTSEAQGYESLRLASSPLFERKIKDPQVADLAERAFKIAAHLGDPSPVADGIEMASLQAERVKSKRSTT